MADRVQRNVKQKETVDTVSAARRRVLTVGLAAVPVILTLKSKPLFASNPCKSLSMSAANSRGITGDPKCKFK